MGGTLKDDIAPLIDELRGLPGEFGFRPYKVYVRKVVWSGDKIGHGTRTVTETRLLVGKQDPKVVEVHRKDVISGDVAWVDAEYDIGPLTPKFPGGGISNDVLNPRSDTDPIEVYYILKSGKLRNLPTEGLVCRRVGDHGNKALRTIIRVATIGNDGADIPVT